MVLNVKKIHYYKLNVEKLSDQLPQDSTKIILLQTNVSERCLYYNLAAFIFKKSVF